jgi:hypothetical protein
MKKHYFKKGIGYYTGQFLARFVIFLIRDRTKMSCVHFVEKKIDTIVEILPYIEKKKRYTTSEITGVIFSAVKKFRKCPSGYYCASKSLSDSGIPIYWALASREKNVRFIVNGYNELSDNGYLKKFGLSNEDLSKYINTIAIKYSFNGKVLPRSFIENEKVFYPNLIIKK